MQTKANWSLIRLLLTNRADNNQKTVPVTAIFFKQKGLLSRKTEIDCRYMYIFVDRVVFKLLYVDFRRRDESESITVPKQTKI